MTYIIRVLGSIRGLPRGIAPVLVSVVLILSLLPNNVLGASSNILHVYRQSPPATSQLLVNNLLTVKIVSYSGSEKPKGTALGSVVYPSDILQVVNTDSSGSEYQNLTLSIGNGNINFYGSRMPSPIGIAEICLITFKMIKSGTATIGFSQESLVDSTTTTNLSSSFVISDPTPVAAIPSLTPSTTPNSSNASNPSTPSNTTGTKSNPTQKSSAPSQTTNQTNTGINQSPANIAAIPLADTSPLFDYVAPSTDTSGLIGSVNADVQYTTSTISWKVNASDATTRIDYGTSSAKLDKSVPVAKKADGTYSASLSLLSPGVRYYYTINASGGGKTDSSYSGVLITRGYPVTFSVTENDAAVESAQIKIGNQTYVVGSSGKKTISLAAGRYSVTVTTNSSSQTKDIAVEQKTIPADGSAPENQSFTINLSSSLLAGGPGSGQSILSFIGIMVGGAIVLGAGFAVFIARRRHRFESETSSYITGTSVVIDDGYNWRKNDK